MTLPDRLSIDPKSPHYNEEVLQQNVGVRFNGKDRTDVSEYCVSEGWIRVQAGNSKDRFGNPMTVKLRGRSKSSCPRPDYFRLTTRMGSPPCGCVVSFCTGQGFVSATVSNR